MAKNSGFPFVLLQIICALHLSSCQSHSGDACKTSLGVDGTCKLIEDCPSVHKDLKEGKRPVNCGFQGRNPIVCCPKSVECLPERIAGETAQKWCKVYNSHCKLEIAGGENVLPDEFPHMAAIGYGDEKNIRWSCGGTLISENFVMTAAHCLNSRESGPAKWVLLGTELLINTTESNGKKGQIHPVLRRIRHPGYKPPAKYDDIALLEIGQAITSNALPTNSSKLHPACLPEDKNLDHFTAFATGWGRTGHAEEGSPYLLKVELNILNTTTCSKAYEVEIRTTSSLRRGIDSTMLCAGILAGGKDTCQGDSGGPLQKTLKFECLYEVWGITSFGKICAFENSPAIYMRVSKYVPWIEKIVWPNK